MSFYPICLDLDAKHCVVVGGGKVADRKVQGLLSCSARVTVISPELTDGLRLQHEDGEIEWLGREYQPGDLADAFLVIAATDVEETQEMVYREAKANNLLLNVADVPRRCNFILPATARQGDLAISVSTGGKSPALARKIRMELEKRYGPEYRVMVDILGALRPEILNSGLPQPENEQLFKRLLHDDLGEWLKHKDHDRIKKYFLEVLGDRIGSGWLPGLQSLLDEEHFN